MGSGGLEKKEGELRNGVSCVCPLSHLRPPHCAADRREASRWVRSRTVCGPHLRTPHTPSSSLFVAEGRRWDQFVCVRGAARLIRLFATHTHDSYSFALVCFSLQVRAPIVFMMAVRPCGAGGCPCRRPHGRSGTRGWPCGLSRGRSAARG